jgi:hypothetical protein
MQELQESQRALATITAERDELLKQSRNEVMQYMEEVALRKAYQENLAKTLARKEMEIVTMRVQVVYLITMLPLPVFPFDMPRYYVMEVWKHSTGCQHIQTTASSAAGQQSQVGYCGAQVFWISCGGGSELIRASLCISPVAAGARPVQQAAFHPSASSLSLSNHNTLPTTHIGTLRAMLCSV